MLDKIKAGYQKVSDGFFYILTPIIALLVYIYFLTQRDHELESQNATLKADKELSNVLAKKDEAETAANDAISNYNKIKAQYKGDQT